MHNKFALLIEYFKYQGIVKGRFEKGERNNKLVFTNDEFDNLMDSIQKVSIDLVNAIKSIENEKKEALDNDNLAKKLRFYRTQSKFFNNLWFAIVILRIADLYSTGSLSENLFLKLTNELELDKSIFYYNLSFILYREIFVSKSGDVEKLALIKSVVDELLNIDVLNICTHFSESYFRLNNFDNGFYYINFASFLLEDNSRFEGRDLDVINSERFKKDYYNFINVSTSSHIIHLQIHVMIMLRKLLVSFDNSFERKVAHYTNYSVAKLLVTNGTSLRLNSTDYMNDPTEGKILFQFVHLNELEYDSHNKTFLSCFTFNHNNLNQFRLYGLNDNVPCTGVSLVYNGNFFFNFGSMLGDYFLDFGKFEDGLKFPLFRCIYMDPFTGYFEVAKRNKFTFYQEMQDKESSGIAWNKYLGIMDDITNSVNDSIKKILETLEHIKDGKHDLKVDDLKESNKIMRPVSYLVKHFSFQEEQECRMIVMDKIESEYVVMDITDTTRSYVEYEQPSHRDIKNIYIGLASSHKMIELLKTIRERGKNCPKTMVSDNPYRV
ncbi:hypothetical protein MMP71_11395 [Acinetobacter dispersus]|uniref:hypothetical protein n=1 Tax=Acinetobacter dispersus TaxID=70348 RepID=UPI001F4B69DC|nr:hypothetical protein [Acinetobacter dispersus]MCH7384454.1 hypothetical protein [Acinetobacter dispersus]